MTTAVGELAPRDAAAWDGYVRDHPRATFFHQLGWMRALAGSFRDRPRYLLARRAGAVVGVLPLFACTGPSGRRSLVSLPHSVYGGALADDLAAEAALVAHAREIARAAGAGVIDLRNRHAPHLALAPRPIAVTFEKALPARAADVLATVPAKARGLVRQAAGRHGLGARIGRDADEFHPLLAAAYHRLGTPMLPRRLFARTLHEFPRDAWLVLVGQAGHPPVAATLAFAFRDTVMAMWTGDVEGARAVHAASFMYARMMELAVERGFRRFDLGRTLVGNAGGLAFKRHLGFAPAPLPYQLDVLDGRDHPPLDPYHGWALRARQAWSRLPAWLAGSLGPSVVRYFP